MLNENNKKIWICSHCNSINKQDEKSGVGDGVAFIIATSTAGWFFGAGAFIVVMLLSVMSLMTKTETEYIVKTCKNCNRPSL